VLSPLQALVRSLILQVQSLNEWVKPIQTFGPGIVPQVSPVRSPGLVDSVNSPHRVFRSM
jgi:hypothetical protein